MTDIEVRRIGADDWLSMREIRLAALQDAPQAFASTYEREAAFTDADWRRRTGSGASFLAYAPGLGPEPAGLVSGFPADRDAAELVAMWVRPYARGYRIGEALIDAVIGWARAERLGRVHLWVSETNDPARRLYERCGFTPTGERQPLPSHPELTELAMARPSGPG
jgi:ribosomal protein S18 acetylase RimI-like enzyme